jgi:(E)-4-hydroxy-3-methylbut-2-enyl-diphosphate synthase
MPLVADIHYDYRVAIRCAEVGVDKIRINPGNIGGEERVRAVVDACKHHHVPIRIGVNGGSLEKHILEKYKAPTADAIAESAFYHINLLEKFGFYDTVVSVKSSDVINMINANRIIAKSCDYPLHLGVTEAGDSYSGLIKSSVGIGSLLCEGIGDTLRVSLTASPVEEIKAAKELLSLIGFYNKGSIQIVSCPTCGRTKIDLIGLSSRLKQEIDGINTYGKDIKIALMGCIVNGPGEAKECDFGIAGGNGEAVLFRHGEIVRKIKESEIIPCILDEIEKFRNN